jgi:hypothetical protein
MTGRDLLVWVLIVFGVLKVALWVVKKRERFHANSALTLGLANQGCAWLLAAHPAFLEGKVVDWDGMALSESAKYPVAIGVAILDYAVTIAVLKSRTALRIERIASALARCARHPTLEEYGVALKKSKITDDASKTAPELEMIRRDSGHAETRRRAGVILEAMGQSQG